MDSLLASYASSDEEDERSQQQIQRSSPPKPRELLEEDLVLKSSGFLSSLPPPKSSSSLFFSLPPPKAQTPVSSTSLTNPQKFNEGDEEEQHLQGNRENSGLSASLPKPSSSLFSSIPQPKASSSSSLFSSLPAPKTHNAEPQILSHSSSVASAPGSRKVVQFRPPTMNPPANFSNEDEDDEDEVEKEKQKKKSESSIQTLSVKSFLSSIPKPRNSTTLGALPSASGTGRRSMLEADVPGSNDSDIANAGTGSAAGVDGGHYESKSADNQVSVSSMSGASGSSEYVPSGDYSSWGSGSENYVGRDGYTGYGNSGVTTEGYSNWVGGTADYANYGSDYGSYGQYENNWADGSAAGAVPQVSESAESVLRVPGKRSRNDGPPEILEVKQDELMKNRPREDQVKLTGIAFGPSYQPTSTKGKPSKLHKRKHQIGSLYYDMKQKETELAERRARGFLTKAQTQGKYGW